MSGGFFRGTSADQDTRFSNKQAKLLKSQKFAPELDHLIDMRKVKMDVLKPWIATRATELLGFEDEVLINFIYGLLDTKEVDGKQIQIQLTGFMEKNTGRFMKELWGLLLSAQGNVSGVPQQFLDAKEEETRKKKAETDRLTQEIQKRKEKEGRDRQSRFDGEADIARSNNAASDLVSKHSIGRASSIPLEERELDGRHGSRAKNGHSRSPPPNKHSPSPHRNIPSPTRSSSKSISRSRSNSEGGHKSRSASVSSLSQRRSVSPDRRYRSPGRRSLSPEKRNRSPLRRSITPRRRHSPRNARSPIRRRSPYLRKRSTSRPRHRSPSPFRYRSPRSRRRTPPLLRHRSPSPPRRRSPSPLPRRSSPLRRRSPSPRRRSPVKARRRSPSPLRRRSPIRRRSPSPLRRRSPPPRSPRYRRRSPAHSPRRRLADSEISPRQRNRNGRSPYRSRSPPYRNRRSLSNEHDVRIDGIESRRYRDGIREKRSPVNQVSEKELADAPGSGQNVLERVSHKLPVTVRSPQRDMINKNENRIRAPVVPQENSPSRSESPTHVRKIIPRTQRRSPSLSRSPDKQSRVRMTHHDSPGASREEQAVHTRDVSRHRADSSYKRNKDLPRDVGLQKSHANDLIPESSSPERAPLDRSPDVHRRRANSELRKKDGGRKSDMNLPERHVQHHLRSSEEMDHGPRRASEERGPMANARDRQHSPKLPPRDVSSLGKRESTEQALKNSTGDGYGVDEKRPKTKSDKHTELQYEAEFTTKSRKIDNKGLVDTKFSESEESDSYNQHNMEKRRHKKSDKRKRESDEGSESDSQVDDKKESKKRRKEERRLRKEERRRRREERHRKRLERRANKLKAKSMDTVNPPSDFEKNHSGADDSDGDAAIRRDSSPSGADETESEQKKLEIELRKKALESLRAKKAISH